MTRRLVRDMPKITAVRRTASGRKSRAITDRPKRKSGRQPGNKYGKNGKKLPLVAPGPLTPKGEVGPPSHDVAVAQVRAKLRRIGALRLFAEHALPISVIAERLGVAKSQVHRDIMRGLDEYAHDQLGSPKRLVALLHARTEKVLAAHLPKVEAKGSADVVIKALERQAKLHGLDKERPRPGGDLPPMPQGTETHYHFYIPDNGRDQPAVIDVRPAEPVRIAAETPVTLPANGRDARDPAA